MPLKRNKPVQPGATAYDDRGEVCLRIVTGNMRQLLCTLQPKDARALAIELIEAALGAESYSREMNGYLTPMPENKLPNPEEKAE